MANTDVNKITGSLLNLFNNSAVISKPYDGYVGSFFFGPNQELSFRNDQPKGRVIADETFMDNKSFGTRFGYDKTYNIFVDFYTIRGVKDSEGKTNYELVNKYLQKIEDAIVDYPNTFGPVTIVNIADQDAPTPLDDVGNNVIGGRKLIVLRERRNG